MKSSRKESPETRLICLGRALMILLDKHHENETIYAFLSKKGYYLKYIELTENNHDLNLEQLDCYKTTIKKLFIYIVLTLYPHISKENIIVITNRSIRRRTPADFAKLLNMTVQEYQKIEDGIKVNISLKDVAYKLNFDVNEFYYNFNTIFERCEKIEGVK